MIIECLIIISGILIGIILFYIVKKPFVYRGPNSSIIKKQIYMKNNKYYKLEPVVYICGFGSGSGSGSGIKCGP